ncbi:MAG: succinylglutamate desuccinylase, partial [Actinobacteria bacterium]|nr:succinylglutamate desuccinylase [Actinomycetota bacterium]
MTSLLPTIEYVKGKVDGPTIAILGGVHGDEFEGV